MTTTTETKCCDKCYSTYTTDDYPDHKTLDACINRNCECHNSEEKDDSHYIPNLGIEYKITKSAEVNIGGNGSSATPEVTEIEEEWSAFVEHVREYGPFPDVLANYCKEFFLSQQQKHREEIEKLKIDLEAEKMSRAIDNTNN